MLSEAHNSLPNDRISDWSELKAYADYKFKVSKLMKFVHNRQENIVEKGANAASQHFLLFPEYFQKISCSRLLKLTLCG